MIIFRPTCVIARSIFPLCLMRLAVGRLHPKSREPINEVSFFFGGGLLCAVGLRVAPSMLSEEEEFFTRHLPYGLLEEFV